MLKIRDSDTGESSVDVVRVPEGFSLQMGYTDQSLNPEGFDYISVIVSKDDAFKLVDFLMEELNKDA